MTTAEKLIHGSVDSFGRGLPLSSEILDAGGTIIDSADWYGMYPPYVVYEFPDRSKLSISGTFQKKASAF